MKHLKLLQYLFAILCLVGGGIEAKHPESDKGKGLRSLSSEQTEHIQENWPTIVDVNPNKIGQIRIEKHLKSIGKDPSEIKALFEPASGEEFITVKGRRKNIKPILPKTLPLPPSVNNSLLPSFPPIGDQGQIGSCVAWGSTYYQASHEYGLLNGLNNKNSFTTVFSPKWTYNLLNNGVDEGLNILDAHQLLSENGTATILDFPYDTNYLAWDLNPLDWVNALSRRTAPAQLLSISSPQDLQVVKSALNNGHILNIGTFIESWVFTKIKSDPSAKSNPYAGQYAASWMNGYNGGHLMTIVGYDDNVWIDINGNGKVDPGEKGAFLVANSWSKDWGNAGFIWIAYDAFYPKSLVNKGPNSKRVPAAAALSSNLVLALPKTHNYSPLLYAQFSLTQSYRDQIAISAGVSDIKHSSPGNVINTALANQGGPYEFDGTVPSGSQQTAMFAVDFTDLLPKEGTAQRYYILLGDSKKNNPTTLNSMTLFDKFHNRKAGASGLPIICDGNSALPYIDYTYAGINPDVNPPVVNITSPETNATVSGTIEVHVNATDDVAVSHVDYYVDSQFNSSDAVAPYVISLDTTKLSNGPHVVTAIAYDTAENSAEDSVSINVANPTYPKAIYVNAGGNEVNSQNITWAQDYGFTASQTYSGLKTYPNPVYQTGRTGNFSYNFSLENGNYTVKLKFAENEITKRRRRIFSVFINGKQVIKKLDLYGTAGFGSPYDLTFPVSISNNKIKIDFVPSAGNATVNAIQID